MLEWIPSVIQRLVALNEISVVLSMGWRGKHHKEMLLSEQLFVFAGEELLFQHRNKVDINWTSLEFLLAGAGHCIEAFNYKNLESFSVDGDKRIEDHQVYTLFVTLIFQLHLFHRYAANSRLKEQSRQEMT